MAKGMFDGWTALKDGLESINGTTGDYFNDYADRVFAKLVTPEEADEMPDYYLCIPFAEEPERYEETDQHGIRCVWTQTIFGFVRDTKEDPTDTDAIELISEIRDDLLRYFLLNPKLDSAVQEARPLSCVYIAGWAMDADYGELAMTIEITQIVDDGDLGSAA